MSFVNLYLNPAASGANDLNSGSTTAAPTHTYGGGTFVRATNTYTVASGNPSTDGFVAAGDYVSVYTTSGRTVATFVMKVDSTTSTTIVGSATSIVYGVNTTVSEGANASSLTIGGSWVSDLPLGTTLTAGGFGTFTIPQATKINMTGNLTLGGASRTIAIAGTSPFPLWFSGYNTNPGDLDNDTTNTLAKPIWTLSSTFNLTASGAHQLWSGLAITGLRSGNVFVQSGASFKMSRCRVTNTSTNSASFAVSTNNAGAIFAYCYFKGSTSGNATALVALGNNTDFLGCVFDGNGLAGCNCGASSVRFMFCVFTTITGSGIAATTGALQVINCTFYACTVNGITWTGTLGTNCAVVVGCLFAGPNGGTAMTNGINCSLGTNQNQIYRACNDYYNVTNPEVGFGDSPALFAQTDSSFPIASATNATPMATSNAWRHGFPGIFENQTFNGYTSIGAVDPLITGLWIQ